MQLTKCSILRLNRGATSQCMSNHTSCTMVVSMRLWKVACQFRKFDGRCSHFKVVNYSQEAAVFQESQSRESRLRNG